MASTKPREIASPSPVPARTWSPFCGAIELVEDVLEVLGRDAVAFVQHLQADRIADRASSGCGWWCRSGAYLAALSSRLNSTCSNSTASSSSIGRSAASSSSTWCRARILLARSQRAADDLAEIVQRGVGHDGAGFELGHVEQVGDEAVEPLGFVDDGREQIGLLGVGRARPKDRAACRPRRARRQAAS